MPRHRHRPDDPAAALWRDTAAERFSAPPLDTDGEVDLAIVGGGFTGCAAALAAAKRGARVCLVEAETIGHGGSGRNVGLVNAGLWLPPDEIRARMGSAAADRLIAALGEAPRRVFDLIAAHGIDCEPVRAGTLHCAHGPAGLAELRRRHAQGTRAGAPLTLLDAAETRARTGSQGFHGALFDPRAGTIQPLAYVRGLARAAHEAGAAIHERTQANRLARDGNRWRLSTGRATLRAEAVLIATNAYHAGLDAPVGPAFDAVHYAQFATDPLPAALRTAILPGGEGTWDTAPIMSSLRLDAAGRAIFGTMGRLGGPGGALHSGWALRRLAALYPDLAGLRFRHAWTGRIAMTRDHIPRIVAFGPRAFAIFGYSGRGIAPGTVLGTEAAEALLGGSGSALPLAPVPAYSERFNSLRSTGFELAAMLAHLLPPRTR